MKKRNRLKSVVSFFIAALLLIQNFSFAPELGNAQSEIDRIRDKAQNTGYMYLEVLTDSEGKANITEDSITWKLVYNSSKESRQEAKFELNLSHGQELVYEDSSEQINDKDLVSGFEYLDKGKYSLSFKPTDEVQEVIFTTKLNDLNIKDYYSYILFTLEENEYQASAEVSITTQQIPELLNERENISDISDVEPVTEEQEDIIPTEEVVEPPVIESVETVVKDNMTSEILALAEPKVSNTVELTEVTKLEPEEPVAVTNEDVKLLSTTSLLRSNGTSSIYSLTIRAYEHNNPTVKL